MRTRKAIVEAFPPPPEWSDRWWDVGEFHAVVSKHAEPVPADLLRTSTVLSKLREALAASRFCMISSRGKSVAVKLEADRFPDFRIRNEDGERLFELAEALIPNPKIGDEYREAAERDAAGLPPLVEPFDPYEEEQAAILKVEEVLGLKAAKDYRPAPHLLIYVNFSVFGAFPFTEWQVEQITAPYRGKFPSAWVLWGNSVGRLWPRPCRIIDREQLARWR